MTHSERRAFIFDSEASNMFTGAVQPASFLNFLAQRYQLDSAKAKRVSGRCGATPPGAGVDQTASGAYDMAHDAALAHEFLGPQM